MATCPQCGAPIDDGATKCEFCGADLTAAPAEEAPVEEAPAVEEQAVEEPAAAPEDLGGGDLGGGDDLGDLGLDMGEELDAEFAAQLQAEVSKMEEAATLSEDLQDYASGFPEWDLFPPEEKKKK